MVHGSIRQEVSCKPDDGRGASTVVTERLRILSSGEFLEMVLNISRLTDRITPTCPVDAKPIVSLDTGFRFELDFSQWGTAVGFCGAFDFLENVQFRHRHSFLGFRTFRLGGTDNTLFLVDVQQIFLGNLS